MNSNRRDRVLNCTNAQYPDRFGNYREARLTQIKHHWWWKANYVFDQLRATREHSGENGKTLSCKGSCN
jgi:alpha-1,6-mannosyl-glycoprotein beta-1,2-N-acetylglucosaminyltransferase